MKIHDFTTVEERSNGYTLMAVITAADFADTAAATKTLTLMANLAVGDLLRRADFYLPTPFDGGATSGLKLDVGFNLGAGTDDPDAFLDDYEIHADGTEVLAGDGNGAVFATLRTGYAFKEGAAIEALFTATGGNVNLLTTGEVRIYLDIVRLPNLH